MTLEQEVFDKAVQHLLTQNAKSIDRNQDCMYRGPEGRMCGVGPFIKDEAYHEGLENKSISQLGRTRPDVFTVEMTDDVLRILSRVQTIHDDYPVANWSDELSRLPALLRLDLTFNPPKVSA